MDSGDIKRIGVLGAGLMGHGIAQVFAAAGFDVSLYDADIAILDTVRERIASNFNPLIQLKLADPDDRERCLNRIALSRSLEALCDGAQVIIEAVSEDMAVKHKIYAAVEKIVPADAILASNTSALSITDISKVLRHKDRFLGTHFWNPPHIVPCVEVIMGASTEPAVFETVYALLEKAGKAPVRVLKDIPGFLGNRLQHAMWREAISLVEQNIASAEDIDKVVKCGFGVRMPFIGPLETADLAGLALTFDIHQYLFPYLNASQDPSPILEHLVAAGRTGVKAGAGFYDWSPEKIQQVISRRDRVLLKIIHEVVDEAQHG